MLICLHIGAHKTASTYMQSKMLEDREKLADARIGVVFHDHLRRQVSDPLDAAGGFGGVGYAVAKPAVSLALGKLVGPHAAQERVVMSDENIAGPLVSAIGPTGFYPDMKRRLSIVLDAMPSGHDLRVFFCVRSYAEHFSSIYAYSAGKRQAGDVKVYHDAAMKLRRGWADVVADICAVAGAERTVVWTYEEFVNRPGRINLTLFGDSRRRIFIRSDKASLPSLSRKGLMVLDHIADLLDEKEHAGLARAVARFTFDPPDEKFSLFSAEEAARLTERYERDVAAIGGLGCELIMPGQTTAPAEPVEQEAIDPEAEPVSPSAVAS